MHQTTASLQPVTNDADLNLIQHSHTLRCLSPQKSHQNTSVTRTRSQLKNSHFITKRTKKRFLEANNETDIHRLWWFRRRQWCGDSSRHSLTGSPVGKCSPSTIHSMAGTGVLCTPRTPTINLLPKQSLEEGTITRATDDPSTSRQQ